MGYRGGGQRSSAGKEGRSKRAAAPGQERPAENVLTPRGTRVKTRLVKRPYQLPEDRGVLWLTEHGDNSGCLFAFADGPALKGLQRAGILSRAPLEDGPLTAHMTYRVVAEDLLAALGLRRRPEKDPRVD
jgi:hypothetical protein